MFDLTPFTKVEVEGPGAADWLNRVCASEIDRPVGRIMYTTVLDHAGGTVCDLTVTRLDDDRFLVVTGGGSGPRDVAWLRYQLPEGGGVRMRDVTSSLAVLGLWGPRARDVLARLTASDLSTEAFGYMAARSIEVGPVPALALRISYVGELGYELYVATEHGRWLWDALFAAGEQDGVVPVGTAAFNSLRVEKGYRFAGVDMHTEYSPVEAGLGFTVNLSKSAFIGREAALREREAGPSRKLCCLVLDDSNAAPLGYEPLLAGRGRGRVRHQCRLRIFGRPEHRLRVPAGGDRRPRLAGRGADLRPANRCDRVGGAAIRSPRRTVAGVSIRAALLPAAGTALRVVDLELDEPGPRRGAGAAARRGRVLGRPQRARWHRGGAVPGRAGARGSRNRGGVGAGVAGLAVGDHVALSWAPYCGHCQECLRDLPHLCATAWPKMLTGGLLDGTTRLRFGGAVVHHYCFLSAFAESAVVPERSCIRIPDDVPFEVGALLGCAVTSGVGAVWHTASVRPGDRVAVVGLGGTGLAAVMGAVAVGASHVIAVDARAHRLERALELGATAGVLLGDDPDATAAELVGVSGGGVDYAFETTARSAAMRAAFLSTRPRGATVLLGIPRADAELVFRRSRSRVWSGASSARSTARRVRIETSR